MVHLSKLLAVLPIVYAASSSSSSLSHTSSKATSTTSKDSNSSSASKATNTVNRAEGSDSSSSSRSSSSSSTKTSNLSPFPTIHGYSDSGEVYFVNVSLGTPPQNLTLRIDTAQSHLWVPNGNYIKECSKTNDTDSVCAFGGAFYDDESETYHNDDYDVAYVAIDGIVANGTMAEDTFIFTDIDGGANFENITLEKANFIDSNGSTVGVGALGLGGKVPNDELDNSYDTEFLDLMKDANYINSTSYSLYVKDNTSAELILGGINQDYYQGDLVYFNKIPYWDQWENQLMYNYPVVPLSAISVTNQRGNTVFLTSSNDTEPVMFDSRATGNYLPYSMIIQIAMQLNAFYSDDDDSWYLRCDIADLDAKLNFQFGNLTIPFPVEKLIRPAYLVFDDGSDACELIIRPNGYFGYSVLGGSFLQQVYLAVDNEGDLVALAHAANPTSSNSLTNHSTTEYHKSAISSGYIPFAKTNNITQSFTFSYNIDRSTVSSFQPDVITASITGNEIFTGRMPQSNSSSQQSSTSKAAGHRLDHYPIDVNANSLYVLIYTVLGVIGIGLVM